MRRSPRFTIAGIMWSVLIVSLALAAGLALLLGDPETSLFVFFVLLFLVGFPVTVVVIASFARWAFTPIVQARAIRDNDRDGPGTASDHRINV
jgi:hypothetical protein